MPSLTAVTRIILGTVAALAGVIATVIGNVLAINIVYFFTRKGRRPTRRPLIIWIIFFLCVFISIVGGSLAAFSSPRQQEPPLTATPPTTVIPTSVTPTSVTPTSTPDSVPVPVTTTVPESTQTATESANTTNLGESILWDWPQDRWSLAHNDPRSEHASVVRFHSTHPDILAIGSPRGDLALLRLKPYGVLDLVGVRVDQAHAGHVIDMLFSPSGDYLITTSADYKLALWLVNDSGISSDPFRSITMSSIATALALSRPAGTRVAIAFRDGYISFRIPANQKLMQAFNFPALNTYIWDIAFSADGSTLYVAGSSNYLQLWQAPESASTPSWREEWQVSGGAIIALATSPVSQNLLAISTIDGTISLWQEGKTQAHISSPNGEVWTLEFSHDGSLIAAGTLDCFLLLLDATDLRLIDSRYLCQDLTSTYSRRIENLDFSDNDTYIAVGYARGVVLIPVVQNR